VFGLYICFDYIYCDSMYFDSVSLAYNTFWHSQTREREREIIHVFGLYIFGLYIFGLCMFWIYIFWLYTFWLSIPSRVVSLQCVAVFCSVLQRVAVCCSVLQCVAVCCSVLQCVAVCCSVLCCNVWQCPAVSCCVLQCQNIFDILFLAEYLINTQGT